MTLYLPVLALFGIIFGWSSTAELREPAAVAQAIEGFTGRRPGMAEVHVLTAVESLTAALCWAGFAFAPTAVVLALALATGLSLVFSIAIATALHRGRRFACACFGSAEALSATTLIRSLGLVTAGVVAIVSIYISASTSPGWTARILSLVTAIAIIAISVVSYRAAAVLRLHAVVRRTRSTQTGAAAL